MDIQPKSPREHSYDVLPEARAKQLDKHVHQLENHLQSHWFDDARTNKLLKKVRKDIGKAVIGNRSSLLAMGYTYDASGYIDPTLIVIDTNEARLKGVAIHSVDGDDRVLCDYEVYDSQDDATMWLYSVPPLAILQARIDMAQQHQAFNYIATNRILAAKMFQSTNFFDLNPEQQQMLLRKDVAEEMIADFGAEYDEEIPVRINCRQYYQLAYGDTMPVKWSDQLHKGGVLDGTIVHAVYLESLEDGLAHIASREDFTYGRGLPCLVLTNDDQETISF
ncbi:MAG: hypothetical protein ABWX90_03090, partial [Candidatus Saccharimonadales bacterium]